MQRGGYDLVHTHLYKSNILGIVAAKRVGCRAILHDHSDTSARSIRDRRCFSNPFVRTAYQLAYRCALRHYERVVVLTPRMRDYYTGTYSAVPDRMRVVPNAVDSQRLGRTPAAGSKGWLRKELGVSPGTQLVAMVGRLEPEKDWGTFLLVARRVGEALGSRCTFIAVGSGSLDNELRERARQLEVNNVVFLGHRPDVPGILDEVDAFLLTSRHEAFGIVVLEAMARGCPVIATRSGGPDSIVQDGTNGLLADVGDVEGIAGLVVRLLGDSELRTRLSQNALRVVSARYEADRIAKMMGRVYEGALSRESV